MKKSKINMDLDIPRKKDNRNFGYLGSREITIKGGYTLEYWIDDGWYVGRIKEVSGVSNHGSTLPELKENIERGI